MLLLHQIMLYKSYIIMTIDDKFREEKLCNDINREAAKISTLSSGKIDKNEFLTGQDIPLLIREE